MNVKELILALKELDGKEVVYSISSPCDDRTIVNGFDLEIIHVVDGDILDCGKNHGPSCILCQSGNLPVRGVRF